MAHKHSAYYLQLTENSSPSTPPSGYVAIYPKTDGLWYQMDSSGLEKRVGKSLIVRDDQYRTGDTNTDLYTSTLVLPQDSVSSYSATIAQIKLLPNVRKRRFCAITASNAAFQWTNLSGATVSGTLASAIAADTYYTSITTTAVSGNGAGVYTASGSEFASYDSNIPLTFEAVVKTGTAITSCRYWVGIMNETPPTTTSPTAPAVTFLYAASGGWFPITYSGSVRTAGTAIGTVATSTTYLLRIRVIGTSAFFSVNNGAEQEVTTNVPATGSGYTFPTAVAVTTTAATRTLSLSRMTLDMGV